MYDYECPYCGEGFYECDIFEEGEHEIDCIQCEKTYTLTVIYSVNYYAKPVNEESTATE